MKLKELFKCHYVSAFFITLFVSIGLIITSFFLPPKGVIDPSVLAATGEIFLWPTLAFAAKAIEEGKRAKITKGDATIEIGDITDEEDPE